MQKLFLLAILVTLFFSNCKMQKIIKGIKIKKLYTKNATTVQKAPFREEISFELIDRHIIVPVKIENENYNFVFDTGASCILLPELAQKLHYKKLGKSTYRDSNGAASEDSLYVIPKLSIGNVDFSTVLAHTTDLKYPGCVKVSGFIGANLMRNAIWQINFKTKKIIVTNYTDSLVSPNAKSIAFRPRFAGHPFIKTYFNPYLHGYSLFDTGASTDISMPSNLRYAQAATTKYTKQYGLSYGMRSYAVDTTRKAISPYLRFGENYILENQPISFRTSKSRFALIGTTFMKDYITTINWNTKQISLDQINFNKKSIYQYPFGIRIGMHENRLTISSITDGSVADRAGIKLLDQVLAINENDTSQMTQEEYCNNKTLSDLLKNDKVTLKIKRNDEVKEIILTK